MVIIMQELIYHRVGHNIDDTFAIAVYKGTSARLGFDYVPHSHNF